MILNHYDDDVQPVKKRQAAFLTSILTKDHKSF